LHSHQPWLVLFCTLQLMGVLEEDEFARNYQLASKLQKVHLLMRVRVWRQHNGASPTSVCSKIRPFAAWRQLAVIFRAAIVVCLTIIGWYQCLTVNVRPTNDVLLLHSDCRWCSWVAKVQMLLHSVLLVVCSLYLCCLIQLPRLEKLWPSISYRGRKLCADSGEDSRRSWMQILLCTLQYEPDCLIMWQFDSYCSVHRNIWIHDFCWHFFTFRSKSRWSVWQRSHFRQLWKIMKIGGQFAAWAQRTEAHVPTSCMVYACLYYMARWANEIVVIHCCHLSSGREVKAAGDLF